MIKIYIVVFYISKVDEKVTAYAASDYGTTDAQINKSYFKSIHFHRSNTRSLVKIILRVGEIFFVEYPRTKFSIQKGESREPWFPVVPHGVRGIMLPS